MSLTLITFMPNNNQNKTKNRSPVAYYGGKANLVSTILPLIPKHTTYIEPFFGGGSIFFAKEKSEGEIINDIDSRVVTFYEVCKSNFAELKAKIETTLFSRASFSVAYAIWKLPTLFSKLTQAWAFYVGCNQGFTAHINSWGFDKYSKRPKTFLNKKMRFDESIPKRLEDVTIESQDACKVIKTYDGDSAFFYLDPPYIGTNCGSYSNYTEEDYRKLLETLSNIKGKFLLSSFPTEILQEYIDENNWESIRVVKTKFASKHKENTLRPKKTEVLTANYPISQNGL